MVILKKALFMLFLLAFMPVAYGQNTGSQDTGSGGITRVIRELENRHSTRIFFREEWIEKNYPDSKLSSLPLREAVNVIAKENNLRVSYIDEYIVLTPEEATVQSLISADESRITVGNPLEYGRYRVAEFTGRITDGQTGESLPGSVVVSETTGTGISAGTNGEFSITLPVGQHRLSISFVGYETATRRLNLVGPGSHDFQLFEESMVLDEVTIYARRAEENITRTRMSVISLDQESLRKLPGSVGDQDIIRSMSLLPGIQSVGEFGTGFHVRGGGADQNLVLLEEVPLFNSSHLFGLTSVVNPDMVTGVTMTKAGIPARYGERASSVMEIRIRPEEIEQTSITGGIGLLNSRIHFKTPVFTDKILFSSGGRFSYSDWLLRRMPDLDLMNSSAGFHDLTGTLAISPVSGRTLTFFGYSSYDKFSFAGNTDYSYGNTLGSVRFNSTAGEKFSFSITGGYSNYDYQVIDNVEQNPFEAYRINSSVTYQSLKSNFMYFPGPDHNIEFGFNAIHYGIDPGRIVPAAEESDIVPAIVNKEQAAELAVYLSDNFTITPSVSIEAGLRYSHFLNLGNSEVNIYRRGSPRTPGNITDTLYFGENEIVQRYGGFEPRIGVRYSFNDESSVKASYTRVNQYINLVSNTSVMSPSDVWKLSDAHLKPLTSDQYALGYFRNFRNNTIEASVEAYYKQLRNVIEYKEGARIMMNQAIETDLVNAEGYNYGIELYARKNSGRLTGWASYTFSSSMRRSKARFNDDMINDNNYFPSNYDKPHDLTLNTNYHISRRWILGGTFAYSTGRPVTLPELYFYHDDIGLVYYSDRNRYRLPDYHRLDISITMRENLRTDRRGKGHWTFSIINVYSRKNAYSVFYEKSPYRTRREDMFNLYKLYIIGRPLPTLTYNFTF